MATDSRASNEWASRPADQRFLTVPDLYAAVAARRQMSTVHDVALDRMTLQPTETGDLSLRDARGSVGGVLSNWAFGQLCSRAKAPAGYLRTLPAQLAAIPLQWSLETHEGSDEANDGKLLIQGAEGQGTIAAVTSPTYGRIWDRDVVQAVARNIDLDVWKVPAASYAARDAKRATTLYASDRDVFMFLVDDGREIDAGGGDVLKRGFYVWNSEVGSSTFGIRTFTYDYVCDNRTIWGQGNIKEITIRHTSGGPHRFASVVPQLTAYAHSSAIEMVQTIKAAKATRVGKDAKAVGEWLKARGFTAPVAAKAYAAAEREQRGYDPGSVWGIVQGLTETARDIKHTDERVTLEAKAGALLEGLAA